MNWDRVGTMKKIDDAGESFMKKIRNQREAGNVGLNDRLNIAKGKDERWEQSRKQKDEEDSPNFSATARSRVPPVRPGPSRPAVAVRNPLNSSSVAPPAPPARSNSSFSTNSNKGYIEFSKFTEQDKIAFFDVLDRFFNDKLSLDPTNPQSQPASDPPPIYSPPDQSSAPKPPTRDPTPSRGPAPAITPRAPPPSIPSSTSESFPLLTASSSSVDDPCSALSAATFFVYPESFPEWSEQWYTSTTNRLPPNLRTRKDILWKCSGSSMGSSQSMTGSVFFQDLSLLVYQISWDSNRPQDYSIQAEYRDIPQTLDSETLKEASELYGDSIASFAERAEASRRPVGDGECWTLAKEAIDNVNHELQSQGREDLKLMTTIGRTHGHLIFAGEGARNQGDQRGRWRGGDRKREEWGGVRRGDIVEWYRSTCSEVGARNGSSFTLGDPEHTAVIISDSPVPDRLGEDLDPDHQPEMKPHELESITVIEQSAGQVPTRKSYDLNTFTEGKIWIYRPVGVGAYLDAEAQPEFPCTLPGMERLT